jgi:malic enzyme
MKTVRITAELTAEQAAALARLCDKFAHEDGKSYLFPHISADVREEQCYQMVHATAVVYKALREAGVSTWPWIDTGAAGTGCDLQQIPMQAHRVRKSR